MPAIQISHKYSSEAVARARNLLSEVSLSDPNWIGATFTVERGDHTQIDGGNSINAAKLYIRVNQALGGATLIY
jgi:hypothetical protein